MRSRQEAHREKGSEDGRGVGGSGWQLEVGVEGLGGWWRGGGWEGGVVCGWVL